jgi:hypothetical protein
MQRRMFARFAASLVALGPLVVAACGGSTTSTPQPDPATVSVAQACDDQAQAYCQRLASCDALYLAQEFGTADDCATSFADYCNFRLSVPDDANSAAHTEGCAQATAAQACSDTSTSSGCHQPTGAGANGAPCAEAGQCASGFCALGTTSSCGTCAAVPAAGEPCTPTNQCGSNLCSDEKICVVPLAAGAPCDPDTERCADGLRCHGTPSVCVAYDTTVDPGEACGTVNGQNVACTDGACIDDVCVANAALGEACDRTNGPLCGYGTFCIGGTCVRPACM